MFIEADGTILKTMSSSSDETRTPRKRATRSRVIRVANNESATERVSKREVEAGYVRRREPEQTKASTLSKTSSSGGGRKAPTPVAAIKFKKKEKRQVMMVAGVLVAIGIGSSAAVGFFDQGQIDVGETIEARNERIRNNQADERDTVTSRVEIPVQNTNPSNKADGGLIGRGSVTTPLPKPAASPVSTSTSTSTDQTASSTDAVASSTDDGVIETAAEDSDIAPAADAESDESTLEDGT